MGKHILIAAYIFSVIYCYMATNSLINRALIELQKRHPNLPVDDGTFRTGFKIGLDILAISAIPVLNLVIGCFFDNASDELIAEVVESVEIQNWKSISEFENAMEDYAGSDRQEPTSGDY